MNNEKNLIVIMLSVLLAGMTIIPTLAEETRTKIEKVNLDFTAYDDGEDGEYGEVEVKESGGNFSVEDVEFLSSDSAVGSGYPRVRVTLYADNDYYFATSNRSLFSLSGEGATYVSATLRDSKQRAIVTVQLKNYSGAQADIVEDVEWDYEGSGTWSEVPNTAYYEVRLKRGNTVIGEVIRAEDTTMDFSTMITQPGKYTFQVRTVNRYVTSNKSKWVSSERWEIDKEAFESLGFSSGGNSTSGSTNYGTPNAFTVVSGWQTDMVGRWYRNYDGTWPASCWQQIDGYWYYFNAQGYMMSNNWILTHGIYYYVGPDGKMWTNTRTPDGYYVDGTGAWIYGI